MALAIALPAAGAGTAWSQQDQQAQPNHGTAIKPDAPGLAHNHRLVLKDGNYQMVRKYEVVGDRVRYLSLERGGEWEELPYDLVDWDATRKWEQKHAGPYESPKRLRRR